MASWVRARRNERETVSRQGVSPSDSAEPAVCSEDDAAPLVPESTLDRPVTPGSASGIMHW